MSRKNHAKDLPVGAVSIVAALSLAACGSSSGTGKTTSSHTSAAAVATTASNSSTETPNTSTTASQATTTAPQSSTTAPPPQIVRADRQGIVAMSSCLRQQGVHVPPQNLSAPNPTFNSTGVNASSPAYKGCAAKAIATYNAALSASH